MGGGRLEFIHSSISSCARSDKVRQDSSLIFGKISGGRGGGKWNKAWDAFQAMQKTSPNAERIMGFAFGMLKNIGMDAVPFLLVKHL
jgi:hypothetical protein